MQHLEKCLVCYSLQGKGGHLFKMFHIPCMNNNLESEDRSWEWTSAPAVLNVNNLIWNKQFLKFEKQFLIKKKKIEQILLDQNFPPKNPQFKYFNLEISPLLSSEDTQSLT